MYPEPRLQWNIRLRHRRLLTWSGPLVVAKPRQPCSPRFKLLARRRALPQAMPHPLAHLALTCAPAMLYANLKPKQTWLRLLTWSGPRVMEKPQQPCSIRLTLLARRRALPLAASSAPKHVLQACTLIALLTTTHATSTLSEPQTQSKQISSTEAGLPAFTRNLGWTGSLTLWKDYCRSVPMVGATQV